MKPCIKCKTSKRLEEFHRREKNTCQECVKAAQRVYRAAYRRGERPAWSRPPIIVGGVSMKCCKRCQKMKPVEEFSLQIKSACRECFATGRKADQVKRRDERTPKQLCPSCDEMLPITRFKRKSKSGGRSETCFHCVIAAREENHAARRRRELQAARAKKMRDQEREEDAAGVRRSPDNASPLVCARQTLVGRLTEKDDCFRLDNVPVTLDAIMRETNRLRKSWNMPQVGKCERWLWK